MARRRKLSTSISTDAAIAQLSDFAALFYTWMIPHAEDDCSITGNPSELLFTVAPSRAALHTPADVEAAIDEMCATKPALVARHEGRIHFDSESFYRHQSYIPETKRADNSALFTTPAQNSEEVRESAQKCASLSPSLSPLKDICPKSPTVKAPAETDWQQRTDEILGRTAFPFDYQRLAGLLAAENKTGKVSLSRVVRELYEPLIEMEEELGPVRMKAGLRAAIARPAPNPTYVRKAAEGAAIAGATGQRRLDVNTYDDPLTDVDRAFLTDYEGKEGQAP